MTLQFAPNTVAPALADFTVSIDTSSPAHSLDMSSVPLSPPADTQREIQPASQRDIEQPPTGRPVAPNSALPTTHLIDWNVLRPDGTDGAIQSLLKYVGTILRAEVHIGRSHPSGGVVQAFSSIDLSDTSASDPLVLRSAVIEASFAVGKFLIASEKDVTSGVLENVRTARQLQFVIGFAVPDPLGPLEPSVGVVLGLPQALPSEYDLSKLLVVLRLELAAWFHSWQACRDCKSVSPLSRFLRYWSRLRLKLLAVAVVLSALLMLVPIPYWPQRQCVVEPSARQFLSSPIDGRVLKSLVRPGDVVEAGQVIGRMDDEQVRWELSAAQAELEQAGKQQDTALAHQEGGKMRIAQLEHQKVALKIQSLQSQLERLELRSPVAGVVLRGEWYRSEGAPVARGDTLFEIAPLENMTVQVHLTTEDLGEITVDDSATVRIDSAYGESWQGKLSRIDPRAAVIDDQIRFVADMEVINRELRLRPGMKGTVRIEAGTKSMGWLVFHRPYRWLMKTLVW